MTSERRRDISRKQGRGGERDVGNREDKVRVGEIGSAG